MTLDDVKTLSAEILENIGNQGETSARLQLIAEAFEEISTTAETRLAELQKTIAEKESLGKANTALWLKLGYKAEPEKAQDDKDLTFDKLFENGVLK